MVAVEALSASPARPDFVDLPERQQERLLKRVKATPDPLRRADPRDLLEDAGADEL